MLESTAAASQRKVSHEPSLPQTILRGSWHLVTRVLIKVSILIITYNPT